MRANWPLVVVQAVAALLLAALIVLGLLPLPLTLGLAAGQELPTDLEGWPEWLLAVARELMSDLPALTAGLVAGLAATSLVWLLAFLLFCFFQAGTYGVLFAADRQARPGARDWRYFGTFNLRDFAGWGARDLWRFFWFLNLAGAVFLAIAFGLALLLAGAAAGGEIWGPQAAVGIGCGGILPLVFVAVVTTFWTALAQALLPRADLSVWQVAKTGLRLAGQRFWAVALLFALTLAATIAGSLVLAPLSLALDHLLAERPVLRIGLQMPYSMLQWLVGALVGLTLTASLVALVRGENAERAGPANGRAR